MRLHLHQMAVPIIRNCSSCKLTFSDFNDLNHHSCAKVNFSYYHTFFGTKVELLLLKLIHLFAREIIYVKKLEIEETKTT